MRKYLALLVSFFITTTAFAALPTQFLLGNKEDTTPAGQVSGLRIYIPFDTMTGQVGWTDMAIIRSSDSTDIMDTLVPADVTDLTEGDNDTCTSAPCVSITSFTQLETGEYGVDSGSDTKGGSYKYFNDVAWEGNRDGTSEELQNAVGYRQVTDQDVNLRAKFSAIELEEIRLSGEHLDIASAWQFGPVQFYDQSGAALTPARAPFNEGDYYYYGNGGSYYYSYQFGTEHPAPTVTGLRMVIAHTSNSTRISDIALYEDGDWNTDLVASMTAISDGGAIIIDGFNDLSAGQYGTDSDTDDNDNEWNNAAFSRWPYADSITNHHTSETSSSGMTVFFRFASAVDLEAVIMQYDTPGTYGDPSEEVTFFDMGGNALPIKSTCRTDDDMDIQLPDNANQDACFYTFANVLLTDTAPIRLVQPAVTGTQSVGNTLTTGNGTWSNSPTSYTYKWYNNGVEIGSETASTYTIAAGDAGDYLQSEVTATNASGSLAIKSDPVWIISTNSVAPVASGNAFVGEVLSCTSGSWNGTVESYLYKWRRDGSDIAGQTGTTYTTTESDIDANIDCAVAAVNDGGTSAYTDSNNIGPITAPTDGPLDDVIASVVVDLDATMTESYSGSGETWSNMIVTPADGASQTDYDFWLGVDGDTDGDEPTFTGSADDPAAYFSVGGDDFFNGKSVLGPTTIRNMHKKTGGTNQWWCAVAFKRGSDVGGTPWGRGWTGNAQGIYPFTSATNISLYQDYTSATTNQSFSFNPDTSDYLMIISADMEATTNNVRRWINTTTATTYSKTWASASTDPTYALRIGATVDSTNGLRSALPASSRIYHFSCGNAYLDNTGAAAIFNHLETRHARDYTP